MGCNYNLILTFLIIILIHSMYNYKYVGHDVIVCTVYTVCVDLIVIFIIVGTMRRSRERLSQDYATRHTKKEDYYSGMQ